MNTFFSVTDRMFLYEVVRSEKHSFFLGNFKNVPKEDGFAGLNKTKNAFFLFWIKIILLIKSKI
jgi:hypothetical protein